MSNNAPKPHPHMDRILRVIDYIHTQAADDLSLDQLADVAAMSRFHWHRVFTAIMGASPAQIIRSVRMHKATMLLLRTDLPIAQIAAHVGYSNDRSFSRTFKDIYGQTPTAFRNAGFPGMAPHPNPQGVSNVFDVDIQTTSDKRLAALSQRGDYAEGSVAYQKVATIISTGNHWPQTRGMAGVYYDNPEVTPTEDLRSHAGVLWEGGAIPDGLEEVQLTGGRYAVLHFKGPYAGLAEAYRYVYGPWLSSSQESLRDAPSFEHYLNDPTNTAPADLLTDIYMPLEG
ncbi:GyrI-like domain-containing protein [Roseobacter sp. OBYS 0001]|uniref:AraC family transcriptional regulator n=1 Tax=Roseobacter sp. OBYS 0001 TaxID=882651 RepID=UPI001BB83EE9|nr:AraC family transcriptional regulator [Roseobacter sp. OBYS 0001]GIT88827.1 AraC family transcriptional regulator [Roseobacter sp. OBYS 0001]